MESAADGNTARLVAEVPLASMVGYAKEILGLTQGQGTFTMEPLRYERAPRGVQEAIIAERRQA